MIEVMCTTLLAVSRVNELFGALDMGGIFKNLPFSFCESNVPLLMEKLKFANKKKRKRCVKLIEWRLILLLFIYKLYQSYQQYKSFNLSKKNIVII